MTGLEIHVRLRRSSKALRQAHPEMTPDQRAWAALAEVERLHMADRDRPDWTATNRRTIASLRTEITKLKLKLASAESRAELAGVRGERIA